MLDASWKSPASEVPSGSRSLTSYGVQTQAHCGIFEAIFLSMKVSR